MSNLSRKAKRESFWERNRKSQGMLLRQKTMSGLASTVRFLFLFGMCFMILQPMIIKLSVSFMGEKDLYDSTVILLPRTLTTDNYVMADKVMNFWPALFNTVWISLAVSLLQVGACTLVGYGFARFDFKFKKLLFALVILTIIVPPQTISTSLYKTFSNFDVLGIIGLLNGTGKGIYLRDSFTAYALISATCMGLKNGLYIFLLRQYFKSYPVSLEEAAYLDGCGYFKTFVRLMLPDAMPTIISCFLFSFVWSWTDRFYTVNFLRAYTTLSSALPTFDSRLGILVGTGINTVSSARLQQMISTGVIMSIAPLMILYVFAQRSFTETLASTGMKD